MLTGRSTVLLGRDCLTSAGPSDTARKVRRRITRGYLLPAYYVIHTVGPVWEGGHYGEAKLLKSCYTECLKLAEANDIKTIAFPCIATGARIPPRGSVPLGGYDCC